MKTDNELGIRVAELCPSLFLIRQGTFTAKFTYWNDDGKQGAAVSISSDLNAMHEAEKTLESLTDYVVALARIMKLPTASILLITATARQRAEAFIAVKRV